MVVEDGARERGVVGEAVAERRSRPLRAAFRRRAQPERPFHSLVLDGVYAVAPDGGLRFHPLPPPDDTEVGRVAGQVARWIVRLLERRFWPSLPAGIRGSTVSKEEEEQILGFGPNGV